MLKFQFTLKAVISQIFSQEGTFLTVFWNLALLPKDTSQVTKVSDLATGYIYFLLCLESFL